MAAQALQPAPLLTVPEVAEILRRSRGWVYENADRIGCVRLGGVLFEPDAVFAYIRRHRSCHAPAAVSTNGPTRRIGGPRIPPPKATPSDSPRAAEIMQRLRRGSHRAN